MTDDEIIKAVRDGTHVLLPFSNGQWSVGSFVLDTWEEFEGRQGVMLELGGDECTTAFDALFALSHPNIEQSEIGEGADAPSREPKT